MEKTLFYTAKCVRSNDKLRKKCSFGICVNLRGLALDFKKGTEPYPWKSDFCCRWEKVQLAIITGLNDYNGHRYLSASVPIGSNGNMTPGCASFLAWGLAIVGTMLGHIFELHTTANKELSICVCQGVLEYHSICNESESDSEVKTPTQVLAYRSDVYYGDAKFRLEKQERCEATE